MATPDRASHTNGQMAPRLLVAGAGSIANFDWMFTEPVTPLCTLDSPWGLPIWSGLGTIGFKRKTYCDAVTAQFRVIIWLNLRLCENDWLK